MKRTGARANRAWLVAGAAVLLAGGVYGASIAGNDTDKPTAQGAVAAAQVADREPSPAQLARTLSRQLGNRTTGAYIASGDVVVPVTNAADAQTVRAAGARPKMVTRSASTLARTTRALSSSVKMAGTGWAVDPATSQVVVWADESVAGPRMARLRNTLAAMGDTVRVERIPGRLSTRAAGGDAIFADGVRCSLGFNARQGDQVFFITAGHCGNVANTWFTDQQGTQELGNIEESSFPGDDFAVGSVTNAEAAEGGVKLENGEIREITAAADPVVGQQVERMGSTTGLADGVVQQLNATVNYPEGTATGMIRTTVCAEPGDSGGPLFAENTALGLTSGGSGDCTSGGITFFQPITEPLQQFGLEVF